MKHKKNEHYQQQHGGTSQIQCCTKEKQTLKNAAHGLLTSSLKMVKTMGSREVRKAVIQGRVVQRGSGEVRGRAQGLMIFFFLFCMVVHQMGLLHEKLIKWHTDDWCTLLYTAIRIKIG